VGGKRSVGTARYTPQFCCDRSAPLRGNAVAFEQPNAWLDVNLRQDGLSCRQSTFSPLREAKGPSTAGILSWSSIDLVTSVI
jgi:hypothetical protein